jgi:hypothetical protein
MRTWPATRKRIGTGPRPPFESDTGAPRPMQACTCSLAGWDPPGMWARIPWMPFHEMTPTDPRPMWHGRRREQP